MEMHAGLSERKNGQTDPQKMREQMKGSPSEDRKTIWGDVLRVDGDTYFMKWQDGKYGLLHTDQSPQHTRHIKPGDRIEAKVDDNNHALSLSRLV